MGEFWSRFRVAFYVCLFTMISAVPATWTTELMDTALYGWSSIGSWEKEGSEERQAEQSDIAEKPPSTASEAELPDDQDQGRSIRKWVAYLTLLALSGCLAYLTAQAIGTLAAEVVGSDTIEKVDVLVLPVSKPIRDSDNKSPETVREHKMLLQALVEGRAKLMHADAGSDEQPLAPNFTTMTASNTRIVLGGASVSPAEFSWQQSWRTVREQIGSQKMMEIVLVKSTSFLTSEGEQDFQSFQKTLAFLFANEEAAARDRFGQGLPKITARTPSDNGIEAIQEVYHKVIKAAPRSHRIGIDITSGDRIYAFAAGLSALHKKAVMFYVSTTDIDGQPQGEPKVACYDVRPKFRSA